MTDKFSIINDFSKDNSYPSPQLSYSPLFSTVGITADKNICGTGSLYFNYNRKCRALYNRLIDMAPTLSERLSSFDKLVFGDNEAELAFYDTDCFVFSADGQSEVRLLCEPDETTSGVFVKKQSADSFIFYMHSANKDDRDPDEYVPCLIGIKIIAGNAAYEDGMLRVTPDSNGRIYLAAAFEGLNISCEAIENSLERAPCDIDSAATVCRKWALECLRDFVPCELPAEVTAAYSKAVKTMLLNLTRGQGNLDGYAASFPSRGGYPTHFLWDSCFQNLGYELLNTDTAAQSLELLAANIRCDGKIPQFVCSTWVRPHHSQPPLVGWASLRLARLKGDSSFMMRMLAALERNNRWWLSQRITASGLISCPHGLETGQDNSPRFDSGATLSTDMNGYLLNQLRCTAELCRLVGDSEKAVYWENTAQSFAERIIAVLYCEEDNIFYDVRVKDGSFVKIVTPCSFIPVWAGVPLPQDKIIASVKKYLLSEKYLFGEIPFPSVAYNAPEYEADEWWRGPTWMPEAWLMCETLEKLGFSKEKELACKRLLTVLINDADMHELFNSRTGAGSGNAQQGWTAGIFLRLCRDMF